MRGYLLYGLAFIGFISDRIFKDIYISKLPEQGVLVLRKFWGGLGLEPAYNTGAVFSIAIPKLILLGLVIVILIYVIYKMNEYREMGKIFISGTLALVIAGGVSNIVDRFLYGGVHDYIRIFMWPIFNIADVMIVVGVILWGWYLLAVNE